MYLRSIQHNRNRISITSHSMGVQVIYLRSVYMYTYTQHKQVHINCTIHSSKYYKPGEHISIVIIATHRHIIIDLQLMRGDHKIVSLLKASQLKGHPYSHFAFCRLAVVDRHIYYINVHTTSSL